MSGFSFNPEEKWDVSTGRMLPEGNHVVDIVEIDATGTSSGGHPQVEVKFANGDGDIRDWIVISSPKTFGKFTALVLAAGFGEADYPQAGEDFDPNNGRVAQAYANKLLNKRVGVVVRNEQDRMDPTKTRTRVKGYVPAAEIAPSDVPPPTAQEPQQGGFSFSGVGGPAPQSAVNDDIPF